MVLLTEGSNAFYHAVLREREMFTFLIHKHADLMDMDHTDDEVILIFIESSWVGGLVC